MSAGLPPSPSFRSIISGIAAFILLFLAFLSLGNIVKQVGAVLTFVPAKLGIIETVTREEVVSMDITESPSTVTFNKIGKYLLYTDNSDLLEINDAILAAPDAKPWVRVISVSDETELKVVLIERGLTIHDTPLAKGRPVASFEITDPGEYTIMHPRRPDTSYLVPDYITGNESFINFLMIIQVVVLIWIIRDVRISLRERRDRKNNSEA